MGSFDDKIREALDKYAGAEVIVEVGRKSIRFGISGLFEVCEHTDEYILLMEKGKGCMPLYFFGKRHNVRRMSLNLGEFGEKIIYEG